MKRLKRALLFTTAGIALLFVGIFYLWPVALSFYAARKADPVTRIVPIELKDQTISQASGMHLSYLGYDFEVPWTDLDESKTQPFPKEKPLKTMVVLTFRSGLRVMVTTHGTGESARMWETDFKIPQQNIEYIFGTGSSTSDYIFTKTVFDFSPDKMHHWSVVPSVFAREAVLLTAKSLMPSGPARSGLFSLKTRSYVGFQQGNPEVDRSGAVVTLFANDGGVEFVFATNNGHAGLTQPEINRIVQTLHRVPASEVASSRD
jgi:hypothetical protein